MVLNHSKTAPSFLSELIRNAISSMSSTVLKNFNPGTFPKETIFKDLFMEGLVLHTHPVYSIYLELSRIFPLNTNFNIQQVIAGEIFFFFVFFFFACQLILGH
ncbi:hypothetical protein HMI56_000092 [Coelomomyces lativittatus]|nr:hypothetical protein HMI56_000092 [Coelomomyces lativittatus]